jgi:hypothetical protein
MASKWEWFFFFPPTPPLPGFMSKGVRLVRLRPDIWLKPAEIPALIQYCVRILPLGSACSQQGSGGILGVFWRELKFADTPSDDVVLAYKKSNKTEF